MSATAAMVEAEATGVVVVANGYESPTPFKDGGAGHAVFDVESLDVTTIGNLCRELEETVFRPLVKASSVAVFKDLRKRCFKRYSALTGAMRQLLLDAASLPPSEDVFSDALDRIMADTTFPWTSDSKRELHFCMETLERAYAVAMSLSQWQLEGDRAADQKFAGQFMLAALWSQLHVDCVIFGISESICPSREILDASIASMRASVLAYSYARQGYELRQSAESVERNSEWDAEDQQLAHASSLLGLEIHQ